MKNDLKLINAHSEMNNTYNAIEQLVNEYMNVFEDFDDFGISDILEDVDEELDDIKEFKNYSENDILEKINIMQEQIYHNNINEDILNNNKSLLMGYKESIPKKYSKKEADILKRRNKEWEILIKNIKSLLCKFPSHSKFSIIQKIFKLNQLHHQLNKIIKEELRNHNEDQLLEMFEENINHAENIIQMRRIEEFKPIEEYYWEIDNSYNLLEQYKDTKEYKELRDLAIENGFKYERQTGSHAIYKNKANKIVVIPDKIGIAPIGTQRSILKRILNN